VPPERNGCPERNRKRIGVESGVERGGREVEKKGRRKKSHL